MGVLPVHRDSHFQTVQRLRGFGEVDPYGDGFRVGTVVHFFHQSSLAVHGALPGINAEDSRSQPLEVGIDSTIHPR